MAGPASGTGPAPAWPGLLSLAFWYSGIPIAHSVRTFRSHTPIAHSDRTFLGPGLPLAPWPGPVWILDPIFGDFWRFVCDFLAIFSDFGRFFIPVWPRCRARRCRLPGPVPYPRLPGRPSGIPAFRHSGIPIFRYSDNPLLIGQESLGIIRAGKYAGYSVEAGLGFERL